MAPYNAQLFDGEYPLKTEIEQIDAIPTGATGEAAPEQSSRFSALARDAWSLLDGTRRGL